MTQDTNCYGRREVLRAIGAASLLGGVAWGDEPGKFDPLHLVDGIEASGDPLFEVRSAAYAISRRRRKSG